MDLPQLVKMLAGRQMKLFDAIVNVKVGTAQGSPISPLLFIVFINPLIDRLRVCTGVQFADKARAFIRSQVFADDICLLAESIEDLQHMLDVCYDWAAEVQSSKMRAHTACGPTNLTTPSMQHGGNSAQVGQGGEIPRGAYSARTEEQASRSTCKDVEDLLLHQGRPVKLFASVPKASAQADPDTGSSSA